MDKIHEAGLFSRILLRDFSYLGGKLSLLPPNDYIFNETKDFTSNLGELAQKMIFKTSEDVTTYYPGNYIRIEIILIKRETIERDGTDPYNRAIDFCVANDVYSIYIIAGGKMTVFAKLVVGEALRKYNNLEKITEREIPQIHKGRPTKSLFIQLRLHSIESG